MKEEYYLTTSFRVACEQGKGEVKIYHAQSGLSHNDYPTLPEMGF